MMHGRGKSDFAIVAVKPANKAEQSAAEPVEQRAETKGNANQQSACRTQSRVSVSQALERIRQTFAVVTRGKSRMRESCMYGSARGAPSNGRPYRDRRDFITLLGGAAVAWPLAARAQSNNRVRLVGGLFGLAETDSEAQARVAAFRHELAELGWVDGNKIRFEFRFFGSDATAGRTFATELTKLAPDAIWTQAVTALDAIWRATRTIPVVFINVADPQAAMPVVGFLSTRASGDDPHLVAAGR